MATKTKSKLTPEDRNALAVLQQAITDYRLHSLMDSLSIEEVTSDDAKIFILGTVTAPNIPREDRWIWNQSKGRTTIPLMGGTVCFFKLNTRKSKYATQAAPKFKLWVFHLHLPFMNEEQTFIWCEKGEERPVLDASLLAQLSFLETFVSPLCANQLGWSSSVNYK